MLGTGIIYLKTNVEQEITVNNVTTENMTLINTDVNNTNTDLLSVSGSGDVEIRTVDSLILTPDFGTEFQSATAASGSTSSTSYVNILSLTTPTVPAGIYFIGAAVEINNSKKDKSTYARIRVDGTTNLSETVKPVVDSDFLYVNVGGCFALTTTGPDASHTITLDYRAASDTAGYRNAHLQFWRIN